MKGLFLKSEKTLLHWRTLHGGRRYSLSRYNMPTVKMTSCPLRLSAVRSWHNFHCSSSQGYHEVTNLLAATGAATAGSAHCLSQFSPQQPNAPAVPRMVHFLPVAHPRQVAEQICNYGGAGQCSQLLRLEADCSCNFVDNAVPILAASSVGRCDPWTSPVQQMTNTSAAHTAQCELHDCRHERSKATLTPELTNPMPGTDTLASAVMESKLTVVSNVPQPSAPGERCLSDEHEVVTRTLGYTTPHSLTIL